MLYHGPIQRRAPSAASTHGTLPERAAFAGSDVVPGLAERKTTSKRLANQRPAAEDLRRANNSHDIPQMTPRETESM